MRSSHWLGGLAISIATFAVFATGACRTIYVGDSGELVTAVAILGIPHPSGYPAYVLLGKLWTLLLPIGSIAFRMSLFSGVCAALTCGTLYVVSRRCGLTTLAALGAASLVAFSPSFWSQATIQRVYSLNALFLILVLGCAFEWSRDKKAIGWLVAAALLAGFGAANHTVMAVVGTVIGVWAVVSDPTLLRRPRSVAMCVGAGVAGLFPYLYLPIRSRMDPRLDWGNPETLSQFWEVVSRRDFWHRAWMESPRDWLPIVSDYLSGVVVEFSWVGATLVLVGAIFGWRRQSRSAVVLLLMVAVANLVVVATHGSRSDIFLWHRYYIPSYVALAMVAGFAIDFLARRFTWRAAAVSLCVPAFLFMVGYRDFDRSRYAIAEDFSRTLLDTLPPGARLAASDDNILFVLMYLHLVEGLRPDLDLILQGVGDAALGQLRFDPDTDPLFFTHHPNWDVAGLEILPTGLVFETARTGAEQTVRLVGKNRLVGELDPRVPRDYLTENLIGHFHYMLGLTREQSDWAGAQRQFELAMEAAWRNDVLFYNLGLIYHRNGLVRRSLEAFERAAEINSRHIASNNPVKPSDKVTELRAVVAQLQRVENEILRDVGKQSLALEQMSRELAARGESFFAVGYRRRAEERASGIETRAGES